MFETHCHVLSALHSKTKLTCLRKCHADIQARRKILDNALNRKSSLKGIDRLLDSVAIILSGHSGSGIVAVAVVRLSNDKIELLVAMDMNTASAEESVKEKSRKGFDALHVSCKPQRGVRRDFL